MDEIENLPVKFVAHNIATTADKRSSLVGRGLAALRKDNDELYRQAREIYNRLTDDGLGMWSGYKERKLPLAEVFDLFQQLAAVSYGKAYFPLSALYSGWQSIEGDSAKAERYRKLAFDWLHANQHLNDPEIWHDLGALYVQHHHYDPEIFDDLGVPYAGENNELAVHWFQKAADAGHASSMWMLSGAYETGEGAEQDWERSLYWQIKAAEAGHDAAQHGLETQHEHGGLDFDDEQVFNWYVWSAENGHVWAQLFLAEAYRYGRGNQDGHGEGVDQDAEQAAHWYMQAANQGDQHAQLQLGKMFWEDRLDGHGVEPDEEQAKHWLERAAEHGDPESQYEFGLFLFERAGQGEEAEAVQMIQNSADQGYGPAQNLIARDAGTFFDVTEEQCGELFDKAFYWYEERVADGDPELRYDFAMMHLDNWAYNHKLNQAARLDGLRLLQEIASEPILVDSETGRPLANGVQGRASRRLGIELLKLSPTPEEIAKAIHWLEQAADLGDALACDELAHLYLCGHPGVIHNHEPQPKLVAINLKLADYWCDRATQLGQSRAAYHLGRMSLMGEDLQQNLALAEKWLLRAANAGNDSAQILLGTEYESGKRFAQNNELAMLWYKKAAERGRWPALFNLARMLETASDMDQAIFLYKQAACDGNGHKPSQQRLEELGIDWKSS